MKTNRFLRSSWLLSVGLGSVGLASATLTFTPPVVAQSATAKPAAHATVSAPTTSTTSATAPSATAPAATTATPPPASATTPAAGAESTPPPGEPAPATPAEATQPAPATPPPVVTPIAMDAQPESAQPYQAERTTSAVAPSHVSTGSSAPDASNSQFYIAGGWDMTQPTGSSADFANVFGVESASLILRYQGLGRASFGGLVAWQSWSAKSDQTTTAGNITIGGVQARGVYINPIYARAQFALFDIRAESSHKRPVPYAAFNFGGAHMVRRVDIGISSLTAESWHWGFAPEIGVEVPLSRLVAMAAVRFNYLIASGDGPEQLYFTFTLGLGAF